MTDLKTPQSIKLELSDCCKTAFRFCKIVSLKTLKTICNWKTIAIQCPDNHFNSIFWRFWFVLLKVSIWFSNNCIITQDWLKFQQNWPSPIESIKDFNFQYENYWKSNGFQCKMTMTLSIRQRQGNLLRGIVNWLSAARSVVQGLKLFIWQFLVTFFFISTWNKNNLGGVKSTCQDPSFVQSLVIFAN